MKKLLTERFYDALIYDQVSSTKWQSPFTDNSEYHKRVRKDAERLAEIAINELKVKTYA
jgi:hypothetical protein